MSKSCYPCHADIVRIPHEMFTQREFCDGLTKVHSVVSNSLFLKGKFELRVR